MLKNYIKIAFRQLRKQKLFSFINVFGLALSMGACLLIILLVKDAHNYDRFHADADRIYRVITTPDRVDGGSESYATSPFPVGKSLLEKYPHVELWVPLIRNFSGQLTREGKKLDFGGLLTNRSFFELFNFQLALGDATTALNEPYSIVLTDALSQKLFGSENPVGKKVEISTIATPFKITGVLAPFPGKTHLDFEALGSMATQLALEKTQENNTITSNWNNYYTSYNFVRLKEDTKPASAELALADIAKLQYADLDLETRDAGYHFTLQPLDAITPGPVLSNSMGRGMPRFLIWFLIVLGMVIMLSACFNYTNLTVARSFIRTREIGVRKVMGASRKQVFWQFINEAVVTALLALGMGYLLLMGMKRLFLQLQFTEFMDISLTEDAVLYLLFLGFALAVGLIAGLLPAVTLSKTSPQNALQKLQNIKWMRRLGLRKILLVVQFTATLIFFFIVTVAWRQIDYATRINFGFDQPQTLLVDLQQESYEKTVAALSQVPGVEKMSAISFPMGTWRDASSDIRLSEEAEKITVRDYFIDENYLDHFGIPLVAGDNFPSNLNQQQERFAIVNEQFINRFDLSDPVSAIGQPVFIGDETQVTIRGVVSDFLFKPSSYAIEPLMLRYDPAQLGTLNLQLTSTDIPATMTALQRQWMQLSEMPFQAEFFDETIRANYANARDLIWLIGFFGIMSLVISSLGLLGMAIYMVQVKAKEISIRKVMGADVENVILLLSKNYLVLFGVAVLIAAPVSFLVGSQVLQVFANRISWSPGLFLPGILGLLIIVLVTIGSQTVRAALANPVESLKTE